MADRVLMKGNEALCRGAIYGGCRAFFGYPITPQNEVPEYMARLMPEHDGVFLQAESELAAINMVYGAAAAGVRAMTSSSGPGISLKQEGISFLAGAELPCVIANVMRGGPGLGNIAPSQSDYFQATRGGGHGGYRTLVFAPWSVPEVWDFTAGAFEIADRYRMPVMILMDAITGQMIEPVDLTARPSVQDVPKPWAVTGAHGRCPNAINSLYMVPDDLERVNLRLQERYARAAGNETRFECMGVEDADLVLVAYGSMARVCKSVMDMARAQGLQVGLFRPISLYPFPDAPLKQMAEAGKRFLTVEMSGGQMVEDVRLSVLSTSEVDFYGRMGGVLPTPSEILEEVRAVLARPARAGYWAVVRGGRPEQTATALQTAELQAAERREAAGA